MSSIREVTEGLQVQGIDETWAYTLDTAPVSGTATGTPTLTVWDEKDWSDVTATVTSGSCSLNGTVITTAKLANLRLNQIVRVRVAWTISGGQTRSCYFRLQGER